MELVHLTGNLMDTEHDAMLKYNDVIIPSSVVFPYKLKLLHYYIYKCATCAKISVLKLLMICIKGFGHFTLRRTKVPSERPVLTPISVHPHTS